MFFSEDRENPIRSSWREAFVAGDFEYAFAELGDREDLRTCSLRGRVRSTQLRFDEAGQHFRTAHRFEQDSDDRSLLELRLFEMDDAILRSACGDEDALREVSPTAEVIRRADPPLNTAEGLGLRYTHGAYLLAAGDPREALFRFFDVVIGADMDHMPAHQKVSFECAAGAAAREMGADQEAEALVFTSLIGVGLVETPLFLATCVCRAHAVLSAWGQDDRATRWLKRLNQLDCPEETRTIFKKRAEHMASTAVRDGRMCLP